MNWRGGPHKRWSMWFNSMQHPKNLTYSLTSEKPARTQVCLQELWDRCCMSINQLVLWNVRLSPAAGAATYLVCPSESNVRNSGDCRVTSRRRKVGTWRQVIMALTSRATHVLQWRIQRAADLRVGRSQKSGDRSRIESAARLHEVGIASNRESECWWIRSRAFSHTPPVTPWEWAAKEVEWLTFGRTLTTLWSWLGWSRNKGSP